MSGMAGSPARATLLALFGQGYERIARPVLFRASAQTTHERLLRWLRWADVAPGLPVALAALRGWSAPLSPVEAGGVRLESPFVVAAGLVKGDGFASEGDALAAVARGRNIIPGWRSVPALVGPVEFGSFTRWPRLGNPGEVVWRDVHTRSTQNRVGLRNPGARAAAAFLAKHRRALPRQYGINIAVSPGVEAPDEQAHEVAESFAAFVAHGLRPAWCTLNLSCPNTEDDPGSHQTAEQAREVCGAALAALREGEYTPPLWVKLSPGLAEAQYHTLMDVFAELGVRAVVATNTLGEPSPNDPALLAGVAGGRLQPAALAAAGSLIAARDAHGYPVDVIGCGGILDGASCEAFARLGVRVFQYWSALVYRGPLAAAIIQRERDSSRVGSYGTVTERNSRSGRGGAARY